jgi:hypothetical protein
MPPPPHEPSPSPDPDAPSHRAVILAAAVPVSATIVLNVMMLVWVKSSGGLERFFVVLFNIPFANVLLILAQLALSPVVRIFTRRRVFDVYLAFACGSPLLAITLAFIWVAAMLSSAP